MVAECCVLIAILEGGTSPSLKVYLGGAFPCSWQFILRATLSASSYTFVESSGVPVGLSSWGKNLHCCFGFCSSWYSSCPSSIIRSKYPLPSSRSSSVLCVFPDGLTQTLTLSYLSPLSCASHTWQGDAKRHLSGSSVCHIPLPLFCNSSPTSLDGQRQLSCPDGDCFCACWLVPWHEESEVSK